MDVFCKGNVLKECRPLGCFSFLKICSIYTASRKIYTPCSLTGFTLGLKGSQCSQYYQPLIQILYGYLFACRMNLNSAGVCIFENFQRLYNARGEAERIIQTLEIFKNTHPLPNDRTSGQIIKQYGLSNSSQIKLSDTDF